MNLEEKPQGRHSDMVVQELDGELLIYDLKLSKAFCLNETSALVYNFCDGNNCVSEIRRLLGKKLKTEVSEDLIWLALDSLRKEKLLEKSEGMTINFGGLSRREVLKKVGWTSLVALPLISSLVAPQPANAQSGLLGLGDFCSTPPQCSTGNCTTGTMGCCAPGVDPNAASFPVCSMIGCASFAITCCSGMVADFGPANCGGAGTECVCV